MQSPALRSLRLPAAAPGSRRAAVADGAVLSREFIFSSACSILFRILQTCALVSDWMFLLTILITFFCLFLADLKSNAFMKKRKRLEFTIF